MSPARARLIGARAGAPPARRHAARRAGRRRATRRWSRPEPRHFVVGDAAGNVVSMTTTVESIFGSGRMVDGFFLNNQMTDFSFRPRDAQGRPAANAVAPGKRPRSSMTPAILLDADRRFVGAIGSAGRQRDPRLCRQGAGRRGRLEPVDAGRRSPFPTSSPAAAAFNGEVDKFPPDVLDGLRARGIELRPGQGEDSGLHGVMVRGGRLEGGADPRREGVRCRGCEPAR